MSTEDRRRSDRKTLRPREAEQKHKDVTPKQDCCEHSSLLRQSDKTGRAEARRSRQGENRAQAPGKTKNREIGDQEKARKCPIKRATAPSRSARGRERSEARPQEANESPNFAFKLG